MWRCVKKDEDGEFRERAVKVMYAGGSCLDGCMFVLIWGRVEAEQGNGPTSELEGRRVGSTDRGE